MHKSVLYLLLSNSEIKQQLEKHGIDSDLDWDPYLKLVKSLKRLSEAVRFYTNHQSAWLARCPT